MQAAQGPLHAEGTWWHVYTGIKIQIYFFLNKKYYYIYIKILLLYIYKKCISETQVTVVFPTSPQNPPYFNAPYSG